jgi:hypothetical protein
MLLNAAPCHKHHICPDCAKVAFTAPQSMPMVTQLLLTQLPLLLLLLPADNPNEQLPASAAPAFAHTRPTRHTTKSLAMF